MVPSPPAATMALKPSITALRASDSICGPFSISFNLQLAPSVANVATMLSGLDFASGRPDPAFRMIQMSELLKDCIPWFLGMSWDLRLTESPHRTVYADIARHHNAPSRLFVPGTVACTMPVHINLYLTVETARFVAVWVQLGTARLCEHLPKHTVQATRFPWTQVPRAAADPATRATRITSPRLPIVRQPRSAR